MFDDYNCGVYVLHYGYAIVWWYDGFRSQLQAKRNCIYLTDFLIKFCKNYILTAPKDSTEYMNVVQHHISALVCSLHKHNLLHNLDAKRVVPHTTKLSAKSKGDVSTGTIKKTHSMVRTRSSNKRRTCDRIDEFPGLHLFLVPQETIHTDLTKTIIKFIKKSMIPFKQFFHPIKPSTNNWRMNYQSKQAIQIFFGKSTVTSRHAVTRYVYGPLAVLKSNRAHPSKDYKVHPFTTELLTVFNTR